MHNFQYHTSTPPRTNGTLVSCVSSLGHVAEGRATWAGPQRAIATSESSSALTSKANANSIVGAFVWALSKAWERTEGYQNGGRYKGKSSHDIFLSVERLLKCRNATRKRSKFPDLRNARSFPIKTFGVSFYLRERTQVNQKKPV